MNSPTQLLNELRERYRGDLTYAERFVVKEEIRFLATLIDSPEFQLAIAIAELNGSTQQIVSDLQSLRGEVVPTKSKTQLWREAYEGNR